jgi:dihydrofolate synthase/folylpolyglutamate synthase
MRFANLHEWLVWQEQLHPAEIELGLERVATVLQCMDLGKLKFTIISVSGTNGKGSSVAMLDAIYRAAGYCVGAYTSPHIKNYNERVSIDGVTVSDYQLCEVFEEIDQARNDVSLTYFEFGTLAAIALMAKANVDIGILEVGLGGRLDAVNILDADVAVISSIGMDHQEWLGDNREKIALEKAGIARSGKPVVCGELDPPASLAKYLGQIQAPLFLINRDFFVERNHTDRVSNSWSWNDSARRRSSLPLPALRGDMQLVNAACVLKVIELLASRWPVSQANIREGLLSVFVPGRFQMIPGDVPIVVDVAHNVQAAEALANNLKEMSCNGSTLAVFACLRDKDLSGIIEAMAPVVDHWFVATLKGPRARSAEEISQQITKICGDVPVTVCDAIGLAKDSAIEVAKPGDRVVSFGSFLVAAEML